MWPAPGICLAGMGGTWPRMGSLAGLVASTGEPTPSSDTAGEPGGVRFVGNRQHVDRALGAAGQTIAVVKVCSPTQRSCVLRSAILTVVQVSALQANPRHRSPAQRRVGGPRLGPGGSPSHGDVDAVRLRLGGSQHTPALASRVN